MKFLETFNSEVIQNFQPILRKSILKSPGGRFLNHSAEEAGGSVCVGQTFDITIFFANR